LPKGKFLLRREIIPDSTRNPDAQTFTGQTWHTSKKTPAAALFEPAARCCYASKRFMLLRQTPTFQRHVAGLMPHPERACEPLLGSDDGKWIIESIFAALKNKTVAQAA
jgi:hypothetical protein